MSFKEAAAGHSRMGHLFLRPSRIRSGAQLRLAYGIWERWLRMTIYTTPPSDIAASASVAIL